MACLKRRGSTFYIQYYTGTQQRRVSTGTDSLQIAKELLRQFESAQMRGDLGYLPTKTLLPEIVGEYVAHIRMVKTAKSAQTDVYYLRNVFGEICPALSITSRTIKPHPRKRPCKPGIDGRRRCQTIEARYLEDITTADISGFISNRVQTRVLAPKTANRYREILCRLFNWSMDQRGVRPPREKNPASKVERYREGGSEIQYLTLPQIDEHLNGLAHDPLLQAMVATLGMVTISQSVARDSWRGSVYRAGPVGISGSELRSDASFSSANSLSYSRR
jgi:hypothetical protein